MINRYDKNNRQIQLGDTLINSYGKRFRVVFAEDILAFGIEDLENGFFDFMTEWCPGEWEIQADAAN